MTRRPIPPVAIAALLVACAGDDTSPHEEHTDTGTASVSTREPEPDRYDYVFRYFSFGWFGGEPQPFAIDGQRVEPFVELRFVEADYFESQDPQHACTWFGDLAITGDHDLAYDDTALFEGWEFTTRVIDTDCEGFVESRWEGGSPTIAIESRTWGLGLADMSADLASSLRSTSEISTEEWALSYEPFVGSGVWSFFRNGLADPESHETEVVRTYQTNAHGTVLLDSEGELIPVEHGDAIAGGYVRGVAYYGFWADELLR